MEPHVVPMIAENNGKTAKPPLTVLLCSPRGFCAGVVRAIDSVEQALKRYGAPVYVRHEIVHNRYVVESLKAKGAVFVEELDEIPETNAPVIFSAHGVPKSIPEEAKRRNFFALDTLGQLPDAAIKLVQTAEEAEAFQPRDESQLAYVTQTTLSLDDTAEIVTVLKRRFPAIVGPHKEDICYATTNRQEAVKRVAPRVDALVVVGAPNSSNSRRLQEVAEREGCPYSVLVQRAADIDWSRFQNVKTLGVTAGASAPEVLVEEILDAFAERYTLKVETVSGADESGMFFPLPRHLRERATA